MTKETPASPTPIKVSVRLRSGGFLGRYFLCPTSAVRALRQQIETFMGLRRGAFAMPQRVHLFLDDCELQDCDIIGIFIAGNSAEITAGFAGFVAAPPIVFSEAISTSLVDIDTDKPMRSTLDRVPTPCTSPRRSIKL